MGKPNNPNAEELDSSTAPLTSESLLILIAQMQQQVLESQQSAAKANEALATAILKLSEPREVIKTREQLAQEENAKMFEAQSKEQRRRQIETKKYEQEVCDHIAGGLGEVKDVHQRTSIIWHRTDAQVDIGICTTCGRLFHPEDLLDKQGRDYAYWRRKGSFNKISAAGVRQFMDPKKAQHDSFLRDS